MNFRKSNISGAAFGEAILQMSKTARFRIQEIWLEELSSSISLTEKDMVELCARMDENGCENVYQKIKIVGAYKGIPTIIHINLQSETCRINTASPNPKDAKEICLVLSKNISILKRKMKQ